MAPLRNPDRLAAFLHAREAVILACSTKSTEDIVAAWRALETFGVNPAVFWLIPPLYKASPPDTQGQGKGWREASRQILTDLLPLIRRLHENFARAKGPRLEVLP